MPNIHVHHAVLSIRTAGPLSAPVVITLPDGTQRDYCAQTGLSTVDEYMRAVDEPVWAGGNAGYYCRLVDEIIVRLVTAVQATPNAADTLVVFTVPEFFFKDSPRPNRTKSAMLYGPPFLQSAFYDGTAHLTRRLTEMRTAEIFGHRTVVLVAGTAWWFQDGPGGQVVIHNIAQVYESSSGRSYHLSKHSASWIDGIHVNAAEVWDRETAATAAIWAKIDDLYPEATIIARPRAGGEVRIGVEICLDWLDGRLAATGERVNVHAVVACGAPYRPDGGNFACRPGVFVRADGMHPSSTTAVVDAAGVADDAGPAPHVLDTLHAGGVVYGRLLLYPRRTITVP